MIKFTKTQGRSGARRIVYLYVPWTRPAWNPTDDTITRMHPSVFVAFDRFYMCKSVFQIQFGRTYVA
jgi:hypothetical protein